jgi:predicted nucleic acid-binding protein
MIMCLVHEDERGAASGITAALWRLPNALSTSVGGFLMGAGFLAYPFFIASLLYTVSIVLFWTFFKKAKMPEAVPVYKEYVAKLNLRIIPVPALEEVKKYTGATSPKDVPVLVSAIKSKADYLITGDKKDFGKLKGDYPFKVTSPSEFLEIILPEILGQIKDTD